VTILGVTASSILKTPGAFESISSVVSTGASGTITFSSIPSTYRHLQIRCYGKSSLNLTGNDSVLMRFNSDSTSNYSVNAIRAYGGTPSRDRFGTRTNITLFQIGPYSLTGTDNMFGASIIDIHNYALTTQIKTVRIFSGSTMNSATTGNNGVDYESGEWNSTAAISSISFVLNTGGVWVSGSTFSLYGIKGS
jgi:hypothetical protein